MTELFFEILNRSVNASIVVFAALALRFLLKKAPKRASVLLWGLVALRLLLPFSIESPFSLMPNINWTRIAATPEEGFFADAPSETDSDAPSGADFDAMNFFDESNVVYYEASVVPPKTTGSRLPTILTAVWLVGVAGMLLYLAVGSLRTFRRIRSAKRFTDNVYISENISSAFVFGVFRPRVFLPETLNAVHMSYVIEHENAHIRNRDHWQKLIGFLLLTPHWFNPVLWAAYFLFCRDLEMACDERVIEEYSPRQRADYAEALLACSAERFGIPACPPAFGEISVKQRIRAALNYRKPAFWSIVLTVLLCVVAAVCFLTNPTNGEKESDGGKIDGETDVSNVDSDGEEQIPENDDAEFTAVIKEIDTENGAIYLNPVEYISYDDTERIAELSLSEQDMLAGYYLYDEDDEVVALTLPADTTFFFFDWFDVYTDETDARYEILGGRWVSTADVELFLEYWSPYADAGKPGYPFTFTFSDHRLVVREIPLM